MSGKTGKSGQKIARDERLYEEIRYRRSRGESYRTIASALLIGNTTVERLLRKMGLPTGQHVRPVAVAYNSDDSWTEADKETLRAEWATGLSASKIGAKLGRTKSSVLSRAHRMGLPERPSPIGAGSKKTVAAPKQVDAPVIVRVRAPVAKPKRAPAPVAFAEAPSPHVPAMPPNAALGKSPCQFPLWSHGQRPVFRDGTPWVCGNPAILGQSWCRRCWGIVYQSRAPQMTMNNFPIPAR